ncbi:MAG TPA: hypothetical protein VLG44_07180 [Chlamydiales bacterium]|nr:hypothetical protein [Chlamydiales bacterium]
MVTPIKKMENDPKKEWEGLWKHFFEVMSFLYDNEGVIENLKKHMGHSSLKHALKEQIDEIYHLIHHHQEDLFSIAMKAEEFSNRMKFSIGKNGEKLMTAIHHLNLNQMKQAGEAIKKSYKG